MPLRALRGDEVSPPLVLIVFVLILGIVLGDYFVLPAGLAGLWALISGIIATYLICRKKDPSTIVFLIFVMAVGSFWLGLHRCSPSVLEQNTHTYLDIVGTVIEDGRVYDNRETYVLKVKEIHWPEGTLGSVDEKVLLKIYRKDLPIYSPHYSYGEVLKIHGQLELPKEPGNPGEFNYREYLKRQGIFTQISVNPNVVESIATGQGNILYRYICGIKTKVEKDIIKILPQDQSVILKALLLGERAGLSQEEQEKYEKAGIVHIFSVSGLHIGFVLLFALLLGRFFKLSDKGIFWLSVGLMFFYAALVGFPISVMRALVMAILGLAARLIQRENDLLNSLALAALIILLWNPLFLFDPGFQLSFLGTWGIVYLYPRLKGCIKEMNTGWGLFLVPVCAQLGVLPLVACYYNLISFVGIISNAFLAVLVGIAVLTGFFGILLTWVLPALAENLFLAAGAMVGLLSDLVGYLTDIPAAAINVATPSIWLIIGYYFLFLCWGEGFLKAPFYRLKEYKNSLEIVRGKESVSLLNLSDKAYVFFASRTSRIISILIVVFLLIIGYYWLRQDVLEVAFLDVGQGDCILVTTPAGKNMLVDGGGLPEYQGNTFEVGRHVVIPYLRRQGIDHLDVVVNTHPHGDHIQGLNSVLETLPVSWLLVPSVPDPPPLFIKLLKAARDNDVKIKEISRGMVVNLDPKVRIEVLHPGPLIYDSRDDLNNNSLVLRLVHGDNSLLLTGDLEKEGIKNLMKTGLDLHSQVLKFPHHGSLYSLDAEFMNRVDPKVVIICVGQNTFGQPDSKVLEYCGQKTLSVFCTDEHGAIRVKSDGKRITIEPFKKKKGGKDF